MDGRNTRDDRKLIPAAIFGTTVLGMVALTAPFVFSRSPLPYMATPASKVRRALKFLKDTRGCGSTFVDLGSGDGEAIYQAVQSGYAKAIGIELNRTLYSLSLCRRLFWSADERRRSSFLCSDFFQFNLNDAESVMIFGVNPLMTDLSRKLRLECQSGTFVLSYRFRLPTSTIPEGDLLHASIIYDEEEMRIYEVGAASKTLG